jgi:hypothetical protein
MTSAPDFEVHMFQLLFPLPIFFFKWPSLVVSPRCIFMPDTAHFFGIGEEANLSAGSYMLWRSISHTVNLLRLQQPYYDIRCSWSVLDHHAADKENEADLARSWHWFFHLGKDIWLIFCSSLSDTCSCQILWQGRHGNCMTLKHTGFAGTFLHTLHNLNSWLQMNFLHASNGCLVLCLFSLQVALHTDPCLLSSWMLERLCSSATTAPMWYIWWRIFWSLPTTTCLHVAVFKKNSYADALVFDVAILTDNYHLSFWTLMIAKWFV